MKRLLSLFLALVMLLSLVPATVLSAAVNGNKVSYELSNPFTDVKEDDWFYDAVQYARINGFFRGTSDTTFDPNGTMTRGMFVTVLGRMAGVDTANYSGENPFKDVPADMYYAPYVTWAAKHGVTEGTGNGLFSPDALINREQMATFLVRYFENFLVDFNTDEKIDGYPADISEVSSWAQKAVYTLWQQGLLIGDGVNFNPHDKATRAETATIAQRTDEVVEVWYKVPGLRSDRVRINPETGLPYEEKEEEKNPTTRPGVSDTIVITGSNQCSVKFYDGERLIDTLWAGIDEPLGKLPAVEKSSKAGAFLEGYYLDREFTIPFYAEEPVEKNMSVFAKYEDMGSTEELNFTSFAQIDQSKDIAFEIIGSGNPEEAVVLEVKDGSDPVALRFEETQDGYIVKAVEGFNEGASYQLHLADGWTFKDKPDTIRTASFSIHMDEVENLEMNEDIVYIKDTDDISYTVGGYTYDVLPQSLITENGGSFNYDGSLTEGSIVCLYVGTHPEERIEKGEVLDPAVYVKVVGVDNGKVEFEQLSEEEQSELYAVPDNFLIIVPSLPVENTGVVNISALDGKTFAITGEFSAENALEEAKKNIEIGDFVTLYVSPENVSSDADVYYGRITAYNAESGEIKYEKIDKQTILDSMDVYADIMIDGDDLVTEPEKEELEQTLLAQVEKSGFAEDAAFMLADMVTKTDGFKDNRGIRDFIIKNADGSALDNNQLELLNLGGSFELTDDIELTVELITKGEQLHYEGGVQLAIGVEAEFEVELESEDAINIELSATFVEEVVISPKVKGSIVYYKLFGCIPIPNGVKVGATIDIKNFTAFSFEAVVYTVAAEEELGWDSFKEKANKFIEDAGIELPDELLEGARTVKDLVNRAKELEAFAQEVKDDYEQYMGYLDDAATIWEAIEENGLTSKEDWLSMEETFGSTSIGSDLMEMMNMTNETGLNTEYYDSVQALMDRYAEMLEQESDWITLVEQKMFAVEINILGLVIGVESTFVVRADLSLAIGSNLEYEVGKRYEFWFKIGLFAPSAGSSTMDLLDERFAFQFYVMGRLGLKAGVRAEFYVGIGTGDLASVGIYAELGPYAKIYGFFIYEYTKYRPANTNNWTRTERMMGALYFEFGLYFIMGFEAEALGLFEYSYEFVDEEIPLLEAGKKRYHYQFDYAPEEEEIVLVKDVDLNSANGITMTLPENLIALKYVELNSGDMGFEALDYDKYSYKVSNPNFSIDGKTGLISVKVPENVRYMECDLIVTYKHAKAAFSTYDMTVTIPLVWTNMSTDDLTQYYTASVRVGNDLDGYETVWTKRVLKNKEFNLPVFDDPDEKVEDIKSLISWNDYKYEMGAGYGGQPTENLTIIDDASYDFNIDYKTYTITVEDVQGSESTKTFEARFGEAFDFSSLAETGTVDYENGIFTAFAGLVTDATIGEGDKEKPFDLTKAIDTRMAQALEEGVVAKAEYVDNSVLAEFSFTGIEHDSVKIRVRRGDVPSLAEIETIVSWEGMALSDIYPEVSSITSNTNYRVVCEDLKGPSATITFEENGGSEVEDITKVVGSLVGSLPTPTLKGHTFGGWYIDEECTVGFNERKMMEGGATLFAKWSANEYTITFHVNGGNELSAENATKSVKYYQKLGTLPTPERTNYGFIGWFTKAEGGTKVHEGSLYALDENTTLYAQWRKLKTIPVSIFDFGDAEEYTYEYGSYYSADFVCTPEDNETYELSDFTVEYLCEGYEDEGYLCEVMQVGTYGVKISRPADDVYAKFEYFYTGVLVVNKAVRDLTGIVVDQVGSGLTYVDLKLGSEVFDLDPKAEFVYAFGFKLFGVFYSSSFSDPVPVSEAGRIHNLSIDAKYDTLKVFVLNERNYKEAEILLTDCNYRTSPAPSDSWSSYANPTWYNPQFDTIMIWDEQAFADFAYLVNSGKDTFANKTIYLMNDIDLKAHKWVPIGTSSHPFLGTFNGNGHTISGLYYSNSSSSNVGLFGYVQCSANLTSFSIKPAVIKNVVVDDSYFYAKSVVGGVVGFLYYSIVNNCTSYADVNADQHGLGDNYKSAAGGIVGWAAGGAVVNCVNRGSVYSEGRYTGGIVGMADDSDEDLTVWVINCANFASVTGSSRVGGIIGLSDHEYVYVANCYNCGSVGPNDGSNDYIGAIAGRNTNDDGRVEFNYYLAGSAYGGNDKSRNAVGKDGGSVSDGDKGYYASSFNSPISTMKSSANKCAGLTLIEALNFWVDENKSTYNTFLDLDTAPNSWVAEDEESYPILKNSYTSSLR